MRAITTILIGAGQRGRIYSDFAMRNPQKLKVVGVAEPSDVLRNEATRKHSIQPENCLKSWEDVFTRKKFADTVMICTQDKLHFEPAMAAIAQGYHILLEKPISPSPRECLDLAEAAEKKGVKVMVCHVLRYTEFFSELKRIIDNGEIGEVVSVVHNENVGNLHHAHSFVRGNWSNSAKSAPMILAKSCHDTDILQWLIGKKCLRLSSFGSLKYFNGQNCPPKAPQRCTDGCIHSKNCCYDAVKLYVKSTNEWFRSTAAGCANPTDAQVERAVASGPYGRCVFRCDNDVVDHQTVNMEFTDGVTAVFTMCSFTPEISRTIKIMGTKGQIKGHAEKNSITVTDFLTQRERHIATTPSISGHGGGDEGIMNAFCGYMSGKIKGRDVPEIGVSAQNHLISFAAEHSRLNDGIVVEF